MCPGRDRVVQRQGRRPVLTTRPGESLDVTPEGGGTSGPSASETVGHVTLVSEEKLEGAIGGGRLLRLEHQGPGEEVSNVVQTSTQKDGDSSSPSIV